MQKYCVVETGLMEHHAGSKARSDVADILLREGWKPLRVRPIQKRENVGYAERLRMAAYVMQDWKKLKRQVEDNSCLLIQYPLDMYPKVAMLALRYIGAMKKRGVKIGILIHDLDSLRSEDEGEKNWYRHSEKRFLEQADFVIAHNKKMIQYLETTEITGKLYSLELFDYLLPEITPRKWEGEEEQVAIAGNLSAEKAGYVYQMQALETTFALYGPNVEKEALGERMHYYGSYPPDELPQKIRGRFGLVWDGKSAEGCEGGFGFYMKYNNPHKTSLYLACDLPVIVWKEAAVAAFVEQYQVGFCVRSLHEIPEILNRLSEEDYKAIKENAKKVGEKIRQGKMLKHVLEQVEELREQKTKEGVIE